MTEAKLWTRDFIIDSVANLFVYLAYYLTMVTIAVYAADNLNADPSEAGLASGIFIIGALVSRIFAGRLIDQVGRKKMLYLGLGVFLATTLLYFTVGSLAMLYIVRFLNGAGFGISATATGTIVASIIPGERRGEGTGYYAMSVTLASAVGPFLGMFLYQHGSFEAILLLAAVLLAVSFSAVFFLRVPEVKLSCEQLRKMKEFTWSNFFEINAIPISVVSIFVGFGFSSILSFLTSYTKVIGLAEAGSFFFMVYAVCILLSRPFTGRWFDRHGENYVMYPSFVLFALGLSILGQTEQAVSLLLAAACVGLGYGTFLSSAQAISVKVSPPHRMGLATSTYFSFIDGGVGIGPFILGFIIPATGYRGMFTILACIVIAASLLYYYLHGRKTAEAIYNEREQDAEKRNEV